jgi:DNA-directed RNA polymerase subunit L
MNPSIINRVETDTTLSFTLENADVSIANALRRVILSEIDTVVFKTTPHSQNKTNIIVNTSRMNNEILKQRLSCIPIHIKDTNIETLKNYIVELNVVNDTDKIINVSTKDFKIKNILTNEYLSQEKTKEIFKPYIPFNSTNEYYIIILYLRPKLNDEIMGEKINLTCEFSVSNSKNDGMFNVVSTCSFGNTPDFDLMNIELEKKIQIMKNEKSMNAEEIQTESNNWKLLDGLRHFKKNSFDFIVETIGVFDNEEILLKACQIILNKIKTIENTINDNLLKIEIPDNTMESSFDIILENEDYTIGNLLKFILYQKFYQEKQLLSFCGFKKFHPHDKYSIIRLAYNEPTDKNIVISNLQTANGIITSIFTNIFTMLNSSSSYKK